MSDVVHKKKYLQCGVVVGTHGVKGGIRVESWCDTPEILAGLRNVYIKKGEVFSALKVTSSFVNKNIAVLFLLNIDSVDAAIKLKGQELFAAREDIRTGEDVDFIADLIGMNVYDFESGQIIGVLTDVIMPSVQQIYVVKKADGNTFMVPAVPEFIKRISYGDDLDVSGTAGIYIKMIEGLDE